jgi:multisubunit Na+/H+ antiporter MnhE subunit
MQRIRFIALAGLTGLIMALLYLAFTDNLGWRELIASAMTGAISASAVVVYARAGNARFAFRISDVAQAWRIPWNVLNGTVEVFQALGKQLFSKRGADSAILAVPFDLGKKENPIDAGRRALAITYTTATPNFIILGLVDRQDLMLYHQITPGDVRSMTRNLGARP